MIDNGTLGLSVEIVHESMLDELINEFGELSFLKGLDISKDNSICWEIHGKHSYCIQAMFIGKTGYGKSTTLNKICGQELFKTDEINSCTKSLFSAEYKLDIHKNHYFSLCDLPGIGESISADKAYVEYYAGMLKKSHCVVYVLRADQRDYTKDHEILKLLFKTEEQKKKIVLAVNFSDKIEPVSRFSPFIPSQKQIENMDRKLHEIQKLFKIPKSNIVFYSAAEGYNLNVVVEKIAGLLKNVVQKQKELTPFEEQRRKTKEIHKMLPQHNCGDCGYKNCWSFAMAAASSNNSVSINDCHNFEEMF